MNIKNLGYDVIYKDSTGSTNSDAKLATGKNNLVIVAGRQSAGVGRHGRSFYSGSEGGLYFTIRINEKIDVGDITFFPLVAALAVGRAIERACGIGLSIKWPNDLLYKTGGGYKKVCGILTEASVEANARSANYVICGVGLNVNSDLADFPDEIKGTACSLRLITGESYGLSDILREILREFTEIMRMPRGELLEEYQKRLIFDVDISFFHGGGQKKGRATGIDKNGDLVALLENGEQATIHSGEINFLH